MSTPNEQQHGRQHGQHQEQYQHQHQHQQLHPLNSQQQRKFRVQPIPQVPMQQGHILSHQSEMQQNRDHTNIHQPGGWRVKLYRLNADGSWDDCGTGKIMCLYKPVAKGDSTVVALAPPPPASSAGAVDTWIYQELGDPTLCMQSETIATVPVPGSSQQILLRTRILLREAYQRQGDNIITWCEPYLEQGNSSHGVDLALSFQDNSGCSDIWRQITQVQSKAADLYRQATENEQTQKIGNVNTQATETANTNSDSNDTTLNLNTVTDGPSIIRMSEERANGNSVADVAHAVAAAHHEHLQRQQQQEMWVNVASEAAHSHNGVPDTGFEHHRHPHHAEQQEQQLEHHHHFDEGYQHDAAQILNIGNTQLPNPPTLASLEEIADVIAAVQHIQQRDSLAIYISQEDCIYLRLLLSLFPAAEECGDFSSLATLAACVKTILLLNDPSIIDLIVSDAAIFEEICATLEYDPDLRDKANHRWFLRERMKFRTVVLMEDEELISAIHRSFRVTYLRDTLLRPTMDESSLSTLSSMQTFAHADVVKGVTMTASGSDEKSGLLRDSYLAKVMKLLGRELHAIVCLEWDQLESAGGGNSKYNLSLTQDYDQPDRSVVVAYPNNEHAPSSIWKQNLAPQDDSLSSRHIRCRGCISFLRELFTMVRVSLQQVDKEDFFSVLVSMEVKLVDTPDVNSQQASDDAQGGTQPKEKEASAERHSENEQEDPDLNDTSRPKSSWEDSLPTQTNLLSMISTIVSNPNADVSDKGPALDILVGIAMHDPALVRHRCMQYFSTIKGDRLNGVEQRAKSGPGKPNPNVHKQILFICPPGDLVMSLLWLLASETDAGIMLQISEIMRVLLDTDTTGEHGGVGILDGSEMPASGEHSTSGITTFEQNKFLSMFYDHYLQWLAVPFQYEILYPARTIPYERVCHQPKTGLVAHVFEKFERNDSEPLLVRVYESASRSSFVVELLSFCVRVHLYRMKCYLLRSRLLANVLKVLKPTESPDSISGERCLKLSALRLLRSVLSVNDEFYHRHIIQHNLFGPVFEGFRANPVGDNLVSSAIVEMCDYIHSENIKSLVNHIVTVHLSESEVELQSLEDVSSPYVSTLTTLRATYEKNLKENENHMQAPAGAGNGNGAEINFGGSMSSFRPHAPMSQKAMEDQRKFRELDQEESYFDVDESKDGPMPSSGDSLTGNENEFHSTRRFNLSPTPLPMDVLPEASEIT